MRMPNAIRSDPLWYKDAILYELHVRAYHDSVADGMGDFRGLTLKLDYLQDLGITCIWLLPFYPSPLKDDGYDTADYYDVHPAYGSLRDFRAFLKEAHRRGLRVVTELVLNHTSDQHPWFQRARRAPPGSAWRNFYVWSDTPERYQEARIIFKDFEPSNWTFDHVAKAYYWHRFFAHQPDLNWEQPQVRRAMLKVIDFWFGDVGVDGLRLDAVPYLFEREGTNCENLPETHAALKDLRRHIDLNHQDKMLLAEANQWPEDAVAYFGQGDECHTAFHFPLMPRMFMALRTEDRYPVVDMLEQTPAIPDNCQWVLFLRNHDELTLEMVTDEERDYMYRSYAQDAQARINLGIRRRLAPLLGNNRRKIELMNGLLLSLPGTPVLYYGDEIGMGDNFYLGDRNGVRTPMQWSPDRNAGFSRANSQQLYSPVIIDPEYHYEAVNVEVQQNNPQSLLWWMKRVLDRRRQCQAFGRGTLEFLYPENNKVLAFLRRYGDETVLVVANLSRFAQHVELNLQAFRGQVPVEMFGSTAFPPVGDAPYPLAIAPHAFYWFGLRAAAPHSLQESVSEPPPTLEWSGDLASLVVEGRGTLERALPAILRRRPWFGGAARVVESAEVVDALPVTEGGFLLLVRTDYTEGESDVYAVTVALADGKAAEDVATQSPAAVLARVDGGRGGILYDAVYDRTFGTAFLDLMGRRAAKGEGGELEGWSVKEVRRGRSPHPSHPAGAYSVSDQRTTSLTFGTRFVVRLLRRLEEGVNSEIEMSRFLTERAGYAHTPPVLGALDYLTVRGGSFTVAFLHGFVPHEGDAWRFTHDDLGRYFERVLARSAAGGLAAPALPAEGLVDLAARDIPAAARDAIGTYLDSAALLGQRTAELHLALASDPADPAFAPESSGTLYLRSLAQSMRNLARQVLGRLRRQGRSLPEAARAEAQRVLQAEVEILKRLRGPFDRRTAAVRTRYHGNHHLGQVLYTGKDFVLLAFEGEPGRSVADRRMKRSPLRDVASMIRSFHYATAQLFAGRVSSGSLRKEDLPALEPWGQYWRVWVSVAFLKRYLETAGTAPFLPQSREELQDVLNAYRLEKALAELGFELEHRLDWVRFPLQGILDLLDKRA
jgi:maltose alpha-D-glucosyltransferase/alpha-amylase